MNNLVITLAHTHEPWGLLAISFVALAILVGAIGVLIGRKLIKNEKVYNVLLFIVSLVLVTLEITHEVGRYKEFGSYDWSSFPFQFCSVSMYLSLIIPFMKKGNVKKSFIMFLALFTTLSGILPLIFAQSNLLRWPTLTGILFSFIWHIILIFIGCLSIGHLEVGTSFKEEYKAILGCFLIFFVITCIAQTLNTAIHFFVGGFKVDPGVIKEAGYMPNYELDPDSASLFYISPFFKSNIGVVFDDIWLNAGWIVCWMVYVLAFIFGAILVYTVSYGIRGIIREIKRRNNYIQL